jgi:2-polyprenyl-3-methyl-5-hydroxy-6-metoxy-1,4-benzoquinol methylase
MSDYIEQYKILHQREKYGVSSHERVSWILPSLEALKPKRVLDFGCGRSKLMDILREEYGIETHRYDPAIPEFEKVPAGKFDLVVNTDVMEHIPLGSVNGVLEEIRALSENVYFSICTIKARQILPNGENAHCTVRPAKWWKSKLEQFFEDVWFTKTKKARDIIFTTFPVKGGKR